MLEEVKMQIVNKLTKRVLSDFVTPLARNQQVIQNAVEEWAIQVVDEIEDLIAIADRLSLTK